MGYRKTENMYKNREIIDFFKECYALEKIHGTSAHIKWQVTNENPEGRLTFFSGGVTHELFVRLFDQEKLKKEFKQFGLWTQQEGITLYGEAYGGKCQGMREVYGPDLKFIVFEVLFGNKESGQWMPVHVADGIAGKFNLEFVHYEKGPATLEWLNEQRDKESTQAIRNGMGPGQIGEGIVVRPVVEVRKNGGGRFIVKHKREEFRETRTKRSVVKDPAELQVLSDAKEVAEEWVTPMRLEHVLSKLKADGLDTNSIRITGQVVKAMIADVKIEGDGEIEWSKAVQTAVGRAGAALYKQKVSVI